MRDHRRIIVCPVGNALPNAQDTVGLVSAVELGSAIRDHLIGVPALQLSLLVEPERMCPG